MTVAEAETAAAMLKAIATAFTDQVIHRMVWANWPDTPANKIPTFKFAPLAEADSTCLVTLLGQIMAADTRAMHDTAALLDLREVEKAADAIAGASRVDIYGASGSALVGAEMQFCLHRIGVAAWAWTDVHNGLASAALLHPGDVALAVSHTGQTRETIEMLAEAGSSGATTIALTSFPRSPLAEVADIVLLHAMQATTFRPDALSGRHPQLVVLDLLYIAVAQRTHDRSHAAFQATARAVAGHWAAREGPPPDALPAQDVPAGD